MLRDWSYSCVTAPLLKSAVFGMTLGVKTSKPSETSSGTSWGISVLWFKSHNTRFALLCIAVFHTLPTNTTSGHGCHAAHAGVFSGEAGVLIVTGDRSHRVLLQEIAFAE